MLNRCLLCHAYRFFSYNGSLSGIGPLSFWPLREELRLLGLNCLQLKTIHMTKLHILLIALLFILSSPDDMLIDLRDRGRDGERERSINVREKHRSLPLVHTHTED